MRPSCYDCAFRCVDRVSGFTMGDFHQVGRFCTEMDDDKGTTCIWIHSEKAQKVYELIKEKMNSFEFDMNSSSTLDTISKMTGIPQDRALF